MTKRNPANAQSPNATKKGRDQARTPLKKVKRPATARPSRLRKPEIRKKPAKPSTKPRTSKQDTIIGLMRKDKGATIADLQAATGWQPHSVRAALTGLRKKGYDILREKKDGAVTQYRIAGGRKGRKR